MNLNRTAMTAGNVRVRLGRHGSVPERFDTGQPTTFADGKSGLRHPGNIDLADIDPIAEHREALQAISDAHRGVPLRVTAQMAHDAVGEHSPGQYLDPAPTVVDLELPGTRAHRILHRLDLDRSPWQRAVHGLQHTPHQLPWVQLLAVVEPHH